MNTRGAINLAETGLRALIREVLGPGWVAKSKCDLIALERKRGEEAKRRSGAVVDEDLLVYTEFYELRQIIIDNWAEFAGVWRSRKYFDAIFSRLEDFRNPDAHSRELLPFEEHLALGLSGEIRNTITIYRSSKAVSGEFYPIIESIEDSLGNRFVPTKEQQTGGGHRMPSTLAVGDSITFRLSAWDPQGREIHWNVAFHAKEPQQSVQVDGAAAEVVWVVSETEVGENVPFVSITMSSTGKYHRNRKNDSFVVIYYTVVPPDS